MKATAMLVLTLLLLSTVPALAQETAEPPPVEMKLGDALRAALENNLDLALRKANPAVAEHNVTIADAVFDGVISAGAEQSETKVDQSYRDPATNLIIPGGLEAEDFSANVRWAQNLRFGGSYDITFATLKSDSTQRAGDTSVTFPTSWRSALIFGVDLPVFAGFGSEVNQLDLLIAQSNIEGSRAQLRTQAEQTVQTVEEAYWTLAGTRAAVDVARKSLSLAGDLLTLNRKKVEVGTLAPIEITQAEAGVASRQESVIVAETALRNAEDELRRLLAVPPGDPLWERRIVPVDAPTTSSPPVDVDAAIEAALANRQDLVVGKIAIDQRRLVQRASEKALRPDLRVTASVAPRGQNEIDNLVALNGFGESVSSVADFDDYQWTLGVSYAYPIGNRAAKARVKIAEIDATTAELELRNLEQDIRVQVRNAARAVESGLQRVAAAKANVDLQRKKLEAEQKKFENGMSTSFEVLTFQNDLASAELSQIQALLDYNTALAGLELVKGTILESRGLAFQP